MTTSATPFDFEHSLDRLQATVEQLESGDLSLEDALRAFETGIGLTRDCQRALDQARQRINVLLEQDGVAITQPLPVESAPATRQSDNGDDVPF